MSAGLAATLVQGALVRTSSVTRPLPRLLLLPGLASRPWWSATVREWPWLAAFDERACATMRSEAAAAAARQPDGDYRIGAAATDEHKLHSGTWRWHSAVLRGRLQPPFQLMCPFTAGLLQRIDGLLLGLPFAYAFFSELAPGARIAPHHGPANVRVRFHIPLDVPSDDPAVCGIRVAGETRAWRVGEPLAFDDSYEHETWNLSASPRLVLLLDVWHPDVTLEERAALTGMFDQARAQGWLR